MLMGSGRWRYRSSPTATQFHDRRARLRDGAGLGARRRRRGELGGRRTGGRRRGIDLRVRVWFNPAGGFRMIPGVLALLLLLVTANLAAMAVVAERLGTRAAESRRRRRTIVGSCCRRDYDVQRLLFTRSRVFWFGSRCAAAHFPLGGPAHTSSARWRSANSSAISETQRAMMTATFFSLAPMITDGIRLDRERGSSSTTIDSLATSGHRPGLWGSGWTTSAATLRWRRGAPWSGAGRSTRGRKHIVDHEGTKAQVTELL